MYTQTNTHVNTGSPYRELISTTILRLQEKTVLTELKDRWWKKQRGSSHCDASKTTGGDLGTVSLYGIFIVLVSRSYISFFYIDYLFENSCCTELSNFLFRKSVREWKSLWNCVKRVRPQMPYYENHFAWGSLEKLAILKPLRTKHNKKIYLQTYSLNGWEISPTTIVPFESQKN